MKVASLASYLGVSADSNDEPIEIYHRIRGHYFDRYLACVRGMYQSPSYPDTPLPQSTGLQSKRQSEAYLRYDFDPAELEEQFNSGHRAIDGVGARTLFFSSGMSAIATLILYLAKAARSRRACIGLHSYFETVRLLRRVFRLTAREESALGTDGDQEVLWLDFPLSTEPNGFPKLRSILERFAATAMRSYDREFYAIIDYSVAAFAFDIRDYLTGLPENMHIMLVCSLQKHMGYGMDLARGGAITIYSRSPEPPVSLARLRAYSGSCLTEASFYLMPPFIPSVIRRIVTDAGVNARYLAEAIADLHISGLRLHYPPRSDTPQPGTFDTSLLFLEVGGKLARSADDGTYPADALLQCILSEARRCSAPVPHGESFGFAMTRLHKWGAVTSDARSVRICVGYDEQMANAAVDPILAGIASFAESA